ncbi:N-acetylglucosaminyl-phosphatidylinositol de-N-acetylase-like [Porites lutea]|uniref:N-acetylglucosaminyl-phosphatidylinositol de-N-acetylase-like n=1 Tax=Porites lutea TaxID=51062 RepID=UPI003CC5BA6B
MFSFGLNGFSDFLIFGVIFVGIIVGYYYKQLKIQQESRLEFAEKKVLVVTAHPDDECMFFSPAILNLRRCSTINLLCLSTGNYYKQGKIRRQELVSSCGILGISSNHVTVVDHSSLPDDPQVQWNTKLVGTIIADHIKINRIEVVLTFDSYGVSGHTNHVAVYKALKRLNDEGLLESIAIYTLSSTNLLRKYISLLDLPLSAYSKHMFLSSPQQIVLAQKAMHAHRSQLVWFRKLYILFSRFMIINTLEELN